LAGIGAPSNYKALPYKAPVRVRNAIETPWTWAGAYLGLNAGYGFGQSKTGTVMNDASAGTPLLATSTSPNLTGWRFGAQAGFNWQSALGSRASKRTSKAHGSRDGRRHSTAPARPATPRSELWGSMRR
jgi:opacity protein-like surface antigen